MAASSVNLRVISDALAKQPFNKKLSVITLHDDLQYVDLVALVSQVMQHIEVNNPNSPHGIDIRNELPELTSRRIADFAIGNLSYVPPAGIGNSINDMTNKVLTADDRNLLLHLLHFLLKDVEEHQKTAYRSRFCRAMEIPLEFSGDDQVQAFLIQLKGRQEEFAAALIEAEHLHESAQQVNAVKKDIQQMEEEKTLVEGKISRAKRKVSDIPNSEKWLDAAKTLRQEQIRETELASRVKELGTQLDNLRDRISAVTRKRDDARSLAQADPQTLLGRIEEDTNTNRFLLNEKLPKDIDAAKNAVAFLEKALSEPQWSTSDIVKLESTVESLEEQIRDVTERRLMKHDAQDKLALFRQQAIVISNKKQATAEKLREQMAEVDELKRQHEAKAKITPAGARIPQGEEFKQYVSQLRAKSNQFKAKRAELQRGTAENAVLQRTVEILEEKRKNLERSLQALEQRHGVTGSVQTRTQLENVSEKKSSMDQQNAEAVESVAELVKKLIVAINEKKTHLSPAIQQLKERRAALAEAENNFAERKQAFESVILALETELAQVQADAQVLQMEVGNDVSRWHYVTQMIQIADLQMDRVLEEMKAYIGGADQTTRSKSGFKTWRDLLNRKTLEAEATSRALREEQLEVTNSFAGQVLQRQLFSGMLKALDARIEANRKLLEKPKSGDNEILSATEQRLVIS